MKIRKPKTTNWGDYNQKLEKRGSINLWLCKFIWNETGKRSLVEWI